MYANRRSSHLDVGWCLKGHRVFVPRYWGFWTSNKAALQGYSFAFVDCQIAWKGLDNLRRSIHRFVAAWQCYIRECNSTSLLPQTFTPHAHAFSSIHAHKGNTTPHLTFNIHSTWGFCHTGRVGCDTWVLSMVGQIDVAKLNPVPVALWANSVIGRRSQRHTIFVPVYLWSWPAKNPALKAHHLTLRGCGIVQGLSELRRQLTGGECSFGCKKVSTMPVRINDRCQALQKECRWKTKEHISMAPN